jgi:N-carbamoylputrescine amidase
MREVTVAATQMACSWNVEDNLDQAEALVREAAAKGAQLVLLQELFETPYFCQDEKEEYLKLARPVDEHPTLKRFSNLAAELGVVLPLSFFERAGNTAFNSVAMVDADGKVLGTYRKSHIPQGPGYEEKFYFSPGDTGFKTWETRCGRIGVGICWDQWFPEAARCMALQGAELLLYPTAIGSEPHLPEFDSRDHWQRVMQGHAGASLIPVIASNRIGKEKGDRFSMQFYGSSFIADHTGAMLAEADRDATDVLTATVDLDETQAARQAWGVFRDRRPELYGDIGSLAP